jgi:hypothetical protein
LRATGASAIRTVESVLAEVLLPNPAEPDIVAFAAVLGGFLTEFVGRLLGYPSADNRMQWAVEGSYYGTGVGICVYLVVNLWNSGLF